MSKLALLVIRLATPAVDRESVLGDTLERFEELRGTAGAAAARRWLRREACRVVVAAPQHRLAARSARHAVRNLRKDSAMSSLWQDFRFALRWIGRAPGFAAVAVATLALGIGANSAMFAVVNAVLLKPLPFPDADRLMLIHLTTPPRDGDRYSEIVW